jgi:hypothetical protein
MFRVIKGGLSLNAKQGFVGSGFIFSGIMHVVGSNQGNIKFLGNFYQASIYNFLFRDRVGLDFKEKIIFAKDALEVVRAF